MKEIVANNIIQLRKENKLTQAELAQKLNYSDKAISKWERGESIPDIEILKKVADMFGVTIDYLVTENAEMYRGKFKIKGQNKSNQLTIALLGVCMVWLLATVVFVYSTTISEGVINPWVAFVWAVPASALILSIFNYMWGTKRLGLYAHSVFLWTCLAALYIQFLSLNIWLIFLVGIPVQVAFVLWSRIKSDNKNK